jgi:hypothetical protein
MDFIFYILIWIVTEQTLRVTASITFATNREVAGSIPDVIFF